MSTTTTTPAHTTTDPATDPDGTARPAGAAHLARLHTDETGAQAMEYAALAGGGTAACGIIISILRSEAVQTRIAEFIGGLFETLGDSFLSLF